MSDRAPRVAVVIPCHDDGPLALQAVRSVAEEEPVEIVVVDDASRDPATLAAHAELEAAGARVVRHERNLGLPSARNSGVRETSAPYVFDLDADDLAVPGALARMADRLDADPGAAVCFGDYLEFGKRERRRFVPERLDPFRIAYTNEYPVTSLFRRSALEEVGGWWPGAVHGYEDWDLWMTLAERGARGVHAGPDVITYRRRLHGARMLAGSRRRHPGLYRQLKARHPRLFAQLPEHRRGSDLGRLGRLAYPVVYGGRPRLGLEPEVRRWLERLGLWRGRR